MADNGGPADGTPESARNNVATRRARGLVGIAGIFSAIVGFLALLLGARYLSLADNARFSLFWSVMFLAFGIVSGLAVETTRSTTAANSSKQSTSQKSSVSVLIIMVCSVGSVLVVLGGTLPAWHLAIPAFSDRDGWLVCLAIVIGAVGYAGQSVLVGALSGREAWSVYAAITFTEASVRMALLILAAVFGGGVIEFAFATVFAEYAWIVFLVLSPTVRASLKQRTDVPAEKFARRVGGAILGLGASSILLVGFPWLIGLTTPEVIVLGAAPLMLAISLTRAPLMVPISALYNVAVSYFTKRQQGMLHMLRFVLLALLIAGVLGGALAWAIGPWLLSLVRPDYELPGMTLAGLMLGAACIAMVTITGIICQSNAKYAHYLIGWLVAVAVAVGLLTTPFGLTTRTILALIVGPLCGMSVHLFFLLRQQTLTR